MTGTSQDDGDVRLAEPTDHLTRASENADAREEVKLLADEQAALRRVATLVATGVEPGVCSTRSPVRSRRCCGADISAVLRFEGDGTVTVMGAHRGPHSRGARVHLDPDYVVGAVYRTGQSASFDLQDWDGEPPAVAREWGVRSALATPVVVEGELWGAITIASLEGSLAAGTDRRLADFSALFATAIANAQSREALAALAESKRLCAASPRWSRTTRHRPRSSPPSARKSLASSTRQQALGDSRMTQRSCTSVS